MVILHVEEGEQYIPPFKPLLAQEIPATIELGLQNTTDDGLACYQIPEPMDMGTGVEVEITVNGLDESFMTFDEEAGLICADMDQLVNSTKTLEVEVIIRLYDSAVDLSSEFEATIEIDPTSSEVGAFFEDQLSNGSFSFNQSS